MMLVPPPSKGVQVAFYPCSGFPMSPDAVPSLTQILETQPRTSSNPSAPNITSRLSTASSSSTIPSMRSSPLSSAAPSTSFSAVCHAYATVAVANCYFRSIRAITMSISIIVRTLPRSWLRSISTDPRAVKKFFKYSTVSSRKMYYAMFAISMWR